MTIKIKNDGDKPGNIASKHENILEIQFVSIFNVEPKVLQMIIQPWAIF